MKKLNDLSDLLIDQLQELHEAEKYQSKHVPPLITKISDPELRNLIHSYVDASRVKMDRIENIFSILGQPVSGNQCRVIENMVDKAQQIQKKSTDDHVAEAGFVLAMQCMNHFKIATYGTLIAFANTINKQNVAGLLQKSLDEEKDIDHRLTKLAVETINNEAGKTATVMA